MKIDRLIFLQNVEFNFDDMVKPAPVQKRPLEIIYNPYPTSCSKFCNHPIDRDLRQEYKDVIRKAKEGIVSTLNSNSFTKGCSKKIGALK